MTNQLSRFVRLFSVMFAVVLFAGSAATLAGNLQCTPAAVSVCSAEELEAIPTSSIANLNWLVQVTPSGYSDFIIRGVGAFPQTDPRTSQPNLHEFVSGELMTAFAYNGHAPMWTTRCPRYPDWKVEDYNYNILEAPSFTTDTDGDGLNEGQSRFGNDLVEYTVKYDMDLLDEGMALNLGASYKLSDRFALKITYDVFNPGPDPITDFSAFLMFHGHPGNTEIGNANGVYDTTPYAFGSWQSYRYDQTIYAENVSGLTDNFDSGSQISDYISIQTMMPPAGYGAGPYDGHGAGKPEFGEHCQIETGMLGMETSIMGAEATLSRRFDLGDIAAGQTKSFEFVIAQRSESKGIGLNPCCLQLNYSFDASNPELSITHGACDTPQVESASDIVSGSLSKLALIPDCDAGFDCTRLIDLSCERANYGFDRFTIDDGAHRLDARFYLARPAARFTSWGQGQQASGRPIERFLFTPSTVSGIDVVDACPTDRGAPADGPVTDDVKRTQRDFSYDVDAWARRNYEHLVLRAIP